MELDRKSNLESLSVIWLDQMVDSTEDNRHAQERLRSRVNTLRTFDRTDQCEQYLLHSIDEHDDLVLLVVSGQCGRDIVRRIHHLKCIVSIFVFCMNREANQMWAKDFGKVGTQIHWPLIDVCHVFFGRFEQWSFV